MQTFYSHGKLLLTAEYAILDGALGLALPTVKGQKMTVETIDLPKLIWKSIDCKGDIWFESEFNSSDIRILYPDDETAKRIQDILLAAKKLNPVFLSENRGYIVTTYLEFERDWGLGSSSTLINNIAKWGQVDAFKLLQLTFGGSGYDIACAQNSSPITYRLLNSVRKVNPVTFKPEFMDNIYFIHLNEKQDSREGIARYNATRKNLESAISKLTAITKLIINCHALVTFEKLLDKHEEIVSKLIDRPTVKERLFDDYKGGSIKSLGAWGGDFVLVTATKHPNAYFTSKGFGTIIPYVEMILP